MTATFEDIREAMSQLPKSDKARLLALVAMEVTDAYSGIDFQEGICGETEGTAGPGLNGMKISMLGSDGFWSVAVGSNFHFVSRFC